MTLALWLLPCCVIDPLCIKLQGGYLTDIQILALEQGKNVDETGEHEMSNVSEGKSVPKKKYSENIENLGYGVS
jgi:hypothetical protein